MLLTTYFLLQCTCRLSTRPDLAVVITRRLRRRPLHEQLWLRQLLQGAATGAPQTHGPTGARGRAAAAPPRAGRGGRRAPGRATPRGPQPATRAPARRTRRALLGGPGGVARPLHHSSPQAIAVQPCGVCIHPGLMRKLACARWSQDTAGHGSAGKHVCAGRVCELAMHLS